MFATARSTDSLAADFHNELYPEAKLLLDWDEPLPAAPTAALEYGHNLIWPPVAAFLVAPFTVLSRRRRRLGDRARRRSRASCSRCGSSASATGACTASFALWPQVIGEIRVSHLTPFLCVLLALAWRYRDVRFAPGLALGLAGAIKFFLWPLGVWLAAIGRGARDARRGARRRRLAPARAAVHEPPRLLAHAASSSGRTSTRTATRRSASSCRSGAGEALARVVTLAARRGAARRLLAPGEPRARGRGGARPLADRVARLLRRRGDPARGRPAAAVRWSGSPRSRRGAC